MNGTEMWQPPGKNCGLCGSDSCANFLEAINRHQKDYADCPFYRVKKKPPQKVAIDAAIYAATDILGNAYDFILKPLPGEDCVAVSERSGGKIGNCQGRFSAGASDGRRLSDSSCFKGD
jgi:hypothetical protein